MPKLNVLHSVDPRGSILHAAHIGVRLKSSAFCAIPRKSTPPRTRARWAREEAPVFDVDTVSLVAGHDPSLAPESSDTP